MLFAPYNQKNNMTKPDIENHLKTFIDPHYGIDLVTAKAIKKIEITDAIGKVVFSTAVFSHQQMIWWDTFNNKAGIYTATIFVGDKKIESVNIAVVN